MERILSLLDSFDLPRGRRTAVPFGNGHINSTFLVTVEGAGDRYILQRINSYVFPRPEEVMENMLRVTEYLQERIREEGGDPDRETIRLVPALNGKAWATDAEGQVWRVMLCVPDTLSPENPEDPAILEECGKAFGVFSRRLRHFPAGQLHETIRGFHDTPSRFRQLEEAAAADACGRLKDAGAEMDFARAREADARILAEGQAGGRLPLRVTHNDTKVNNVLLDRKTGKAVCVVDLDTVMPGLAAYDFGDAVRAGACSTAEDEPDASGTRLVLPRFEAFARGFLREMRTDLSREELMSLEAGARLMTFECGMRFLADHLDGDRYFRIRRPGQNLDRARVQFALVRDMERHRQEMTDILERLYGEE